MNNYQLSKKGAAGTARAACDLTFDAWLAVQIQIRITSNVSYVQRIHICIIPFLISYLL
jgi:hypothetical protein